MSKAPVPSFPPPPPPPFEAARPPQREQPPPQPALDSTLSAMSPLSAERERAAEEALLQSLDHVVTEYVRQDIMETLGLSHRGAAGQRGMDPHDSSGELEFCPGKVIHNGKIAMLMLVVMFGLLPMLSMMAISTALVGCVAVYIADFLNYRHASILVLAIALASFGCSLWISNIATVWSSTGGFLMLTNTSLLLIVAFCGAVLQYRWVQLTYPELTCFLERFIVGTLPLLALPSIFTTCLAFCGARNGTFAFAAAVCVLHRCFYCRLRSSFCTSLASPEMHDDNFVTGKYEACTFTIATLFLPMVLYMVVQSNWIPATMPFHFANLFALLGAALCYLLHNIRTTLWFMFPYGETLVDQLRNDPLDVWRSVEAAQKGIVGCCAFALLHWGIYRLLHSRYAYLFAGVPFPYNALLLAVAGYAGAFVAYATRRILIADASDDKHAAQKSGLVSMRLVVMLLSLVATLLVGIVAGMPGFFLPMSALSVSCFHAFLMNRREGNTFFMFVCTSSILLLWWMYKTFSFVIVDLRVLNDAVVPTPLLAISILWCYIIGCLTFNLSFSPNKAVFKALLAMWAVKVAWVEHVLYSQREVNAYPAVLVLVTSALASYVILRLYHHGVVDGNFYTGLAFGLWVAKLATYLQEITQDEFVGDRAADFLGGATAVRALEVFVGNTATTIAAAAFFTLETERSENKRRAEPTMLITYLASCIALAGSARRNLLRATFDAATHHGAAYTVPRQLGLILALSALLCAPLLVRHGAKFVGVQRIVTSLLIAGTALFLGDPIIEAVVNPEEDDGDIAFIRPRPWARMLVCLAGLLLVVGRFIPFAKKELPHALRISYWGLFCVLAAASTAGMLMPAVNLHVIVALCCFTALSAVVVDVCHYTRCEKYVAWILYAASVLSMVVTYVALNSVDLSQFTTNDIYVYEAHAASRTALLSLTFCINFGMGALLKFRLSAASLLPRPRPLTNHIVTQVGLVCNYCVLLGEITSFIIIYYNADANPLLFVASALLLLLLHDDEVLFFDLHRELFRYFPPFAAINCALWGLQLHHAGSALMAKGAWDACGVLWPALLVLPSHVSIASLLFLGKKRGGVVKGAVFAFVAVDTLVLLLTAMPVVRWMAMVGVCSQIGRLFLAEFWRRSHSTLL